MKQPEAKERTRERRKKPKYRACAHEYDKKYRQKPEVKERDKTKQSSRRARKLNLPCDFTDDQWLNALEYFGHKCAVCGRPRGLWHSLSQDHWIPLASPECPGTVVSNIVPLCHGINGCNTSKNRTPAEQWLTLQFGKRKAKEILARVNAYFEWVKTT